MQDLSIPGCDDQTNNKNSTCDIKLFNEFD